MLKKIICAVMAVMMLVALVACQPSNNEELDKLQQQMQELENKYANINELQQQAQKLKEEIASLNELLEALQSENSSLAGQTQDALEQITQLQEDINKKQKTIDELENILNDVVVERIDFFHRAGGNGNGGEPVNEMACGYRFLQVPYNRNNVEIRFYVGHYSDTCPDEDRDDNDIHDYVEIKLRSGYYEMYDDYYGSHKLHDNATVVSRINNFYKSKYSRQAFDLTNVNEFNYSEKVIIPQELFVDEEGFILVHSQYHFLNSNNEYVAGAECVSIEIGYRVIGEDVILFPDLLDH